MIWLDEIFFVLPLLWLDELYEMYECKQTIMSTKEPMTRIEVNKSMFKKNEFIKAEKQTEYIVTLV